MTGKEETDESRKAEVLVGLRVPSQPALLMGAKQKPRREQEARKRGRLGMWKIGSVENKRRAERKQGEGRKSEGEARR